MTEIKETSFIVAEAIIAQWRANSVEEVDPGVEFCDCPKQGIFDIVEQIRGHYEDGRYTGHISGVLMVCDICGKQVFATMQSHFMEM